MNIPNNWPVHPNLDPGNIKTADQHFMYPDYTFQDITGKGEEAFSTKFGQDKNPGFWEYSSSPSSLPPQKESSNFLNRLRQVNIHDVATAVNLGNALVNTFKGGPPPVTYTKPAAHLVQLDTSPIQNAYAKALAAINTSQDNIRQGTTSTGDVVQGAAFAGAQILQAQNQAATQEAGLKNQVAAQNAQILNTVEGQRAQIENDERRTNLEMQYQDARLREAAVHSNLQSAFTNQMAKRQEAIQQADMERSMLIQREALKMAIEQDAFESGDFDNFRLKFYQQHIDAVDNELGDISSLDNPIYADMKGTYEEDFNKLYTPPEKLGERLGQIDAQLAQMEGKTIEGGDELRSSLQKERAGLSAQVALDRSTQLDVYRTRRMTKVYGEERARRITERTGEKSVRDAYRKEMGIPASNMSQLMVMLEMNK